MISGGIPAKMLNVMRLRYSILSFSFSYFFWYLITRSSTAARINVIRAIHQKYPVDSHGILIWDRT